MTLVVPMKLHYVLNTGSVNVKSLMKSFSLPMQAYAPKQLPIPASRFSEELYQPQLTRREVTTLNLVITVCTRVSQTIVATSATSTTNDKQKVNSNTWLYIRNAIYVQ